MGVVSGNCFLDGILSFGLYLELFTGLQSG